MEKTYRTGIRRSADIGELPDCVAFRIDEDSAREILKLSALVKEHGLYKVEKFDFRACYTRTQPVASEQVGSVPMQHIVSTEADCLNVSDSEFWFSAYLKHTDIQINSEAQSIADLQACVGLTT